MSKISNKDLRYFIRDFLFENQVNVNYKPDDGHYVNYSLYDRAVPKINGKGEVLDQETSFDIDKDMPLSPSDIMVDPNFLKVVHSIEDKNYEPVNKKELRSAVLTLIDRCEDLESQNTIVKAWKNFKTVINKVCNK